jgi:hypothetical protein
MRRSRWVVWLVTAVAFAARATAAPQPSSPPSLPAALDCGCIDRGPLISLHDRIVTTATIAEARAVALEPTLLAREALSRARWLALRSDAFREAEDRLVAYQGDVQAATSAAEVGQHFAELVHLEPELVVTDAPFIGEAAACAFSTLEIVAIVLGFILGIIPGIILLLILC